MDTSQHSLQQVTSQQQQTLAAKLINVGKKIESVGKLGYNSGLGYSYTTYSSVVKPLRSALYQENVFMTADVEAFELFTVQGKNGILQGVHLWVRYTFLDADSGATISFRGFGSGVDYTDKAVPKAHTSAMKYALKNAFLIPDDANPEAASEGDEQSPPPSKANGKAAQVVSVEQGKQLFAVAAQAGYTKDQILAAMTKLGYNSTFEVTLADFEKLRMWFQRNPKK